MSNPYPHPILAREGWPFILCSVCLSVILSFVLGLWSLPFWLITVFVVQFFRDPARTIPQQANAVLSPADGRIVVVERSQDPQLKRDAIKVSVFMNVFNVHVNRAPYEGTIEKISYHPGKFVSANLDKASTENERNEVLIRTEDGRAIWTVQIAGLIARRIVCWIREGETLAKGERFGMIRFGSRVEVFLPADSRVVVRLNDKVRAGQTPLGYLS